MIIAQVSLAPVGKGTSLSKYVKKAIEVFEKENIKFRTNPMSTVIETEDIEKLFDVIKKAHQSIIDLDVERVITEVKIDHRIDKNVDMDKKLDSLK